MKDWRTKEPDLEAEARIERKKLEIEVLLKEYEEAIVAATAWSAEWKRRHTRHGFHCKAGEAS